MALYTHWQTQAGIVDTLDPASETIHSNGRVFLMRPPLKLMRSSHKRQWVPAGMESRERSFIAQKRIEATSPLSPSLPLCGAECRREHRS